MRKMKTMVQFRWMSMIYRGLLIRSIEAMREFPGRYFPEKEAACMSCCSLVTRIFLITNCPIDWSDRSVESLKCRGNQIRLITLIKFYLMDEIFIEVWNCPSIGFWNWQVYYFSNGFHIKSIFGLNFVWNPCWIKIFFYSYLRIIDTCRNRDDACLS